MKSEKGIFDCRRAPLSGLSVPLMWSPLFSLPVTDSGKTWRPLAPDFLSRSGSYRHLYCGVLLCEMYGAGVESGSVNYVMSVQG